MTFQDEEENEAALFEQMVEDIEEKDADGVSNKICACDE